MTERLESAVVEAAVKWRESDIAASVDSSVDLFMVEVALIDAVDALIAVRSETKGKSQDDLASEDREHVPCEESK